MGAVPRAGGRWCAGGGAGATEVTDLVGETLDRLAGELPSDQRERFVELMRAGLAEFDPVVGPEDQVVEIEAAVDVPPGERLAAAQRFAEKRRAFTLGRRSGELLQAFAA